MVGVSRLQKQKYNEFEAKPRYAEVQVNNVSPFHGLWTQGVKQYMTNGLPSLPLPNRKADAMRLFSPRTIYEKFEFETLLGLEA